MWDYSIYLGNESDKVHVDFISTDRLFIVASIGDAIDKDEFKEIFESVGKIVVVEHIDNLNSFEKAVDEAFKKLEKNATFALAASLAVDNVLYLVTRGGGKIFINRGSSFQPLIAGSHTSSGYLQDQDLVVLTTSQFVVRISEHALQRFIQDKGTQEIVEALTPDLKGNDDTGLIALFARYQGHGTEETEPVEEGAVASYTVAPPTARRFNIKEMIARLRGGTNAGSSSLGKKLTFVVLVVLVGVFIWSVILGNQRRQRNAFIKKVETQATTIDSQLEEAATLTSTNIDRSLELLASAKSAYGTLKEEATDKKLADLAQLKGIASHIKDAEKSIKKEEETATEEFYDLNLIEKGATAIRFYYDGTTLTMLDPDKAKVYLLNLEKKSVVTRKDSKVVGAICVAFHQEEPYVFSAKDGVFRISKEKAELLVDKDGEWGLIKDCGMYSGNIYILDADKDEIYKYLVAESGYSAKNSYIKSGKTDLAKASAMTIDGAVYVALGSRVLKYEAGNNAPFTIKLPITGTIEFDDIFTSRDLDKIYLLDKESRKIFIVSKEGEFLKQVAASVIGNADDFVVDKTEGILLLVKDKIIKIVE